MAKFRKKPVVIEAVRLTFAEWDGKHGDHSWDGDPFSEEPAWLDTSQISIKLSDSGAEYLGWEIETLEGKMLASPGDWIIRGVKGELYPCKNEVFELTYEAA